MLVEVEIKILCRFAATRRTSARFEVEKVYRKKLVDLIGELSFDSDKFVIVISR